MKRNPEIVWLSAIFEAHKNHVVAIFKLNGSTIGIRFTSPEQLLGFFLQLMEKAVQVWPDNEWIKEYLKKE